jgi:hypothetical protein
MPRDTWRLDNFEILKEAIRLNQEAFDMRSWAEEDSSSPCGTVGCIGGTCDWLLLLSGEKPKTGEHVFNRKGHIPQIKLSDQLYRGQVCEDNACQYLGVDRQEAWVLFFEPNWPKSFANEYKTAATRNQRTRVAIKRINHFLRTGK